MKPNLYIVPKIPRNRPAVGWVVADVVCWLVIGWLVVAAWCGWLD